jgi:hypothetical protein
MKRLLAWGLVLVVSLLLLLLALPAAAGQGPIEKMKRTQNPIETFAMDGPRLAYAVEDANGCDRVYVWNVLTGHRARASKGESCDYARVVALAVSRGRTAWIEVSCGNSECDYALYSSSFPKLSERRLAVAIRMGDDCSAGGCLMGDWIDGLVGSGKVLAVSRWSVDPNGTFLKGGLYRLGTAGLKRVVAGQNGIIAWAADAGRIAVLRPLGKSARFPAVAYQGSTVGIYSAAGRLLRSVRPSSAREVAVSGNTLLVLTQIPRLEVYNLRTGTRLHSWKVPHGATNLDTYAGVAVYADHPRGPSVCCDPFKVHVLQLTTGKDVIVGRGTFWSGQGLEIEEPGLVYKHDPHTFVFLPLKRVLAALAPR